MQQIPSKPSDVKWTDDQLTAIQAKGTDILVAAAAGSGKTAVLIERLIKKVTSKEADRIDVDELLVVTFTNASAAEMRNRMAEALEKAISNDPYNRELRRQLSLIGKAQISTLHSFCLAICRQYAYMIDLDPGFRIASQDEAALLRDDVLAQVLEQAYKGELAGLTKDEVYRLVDSFTSDRNDQQIEKLLDKLYEMSRVQPDPYAWLDKLPVAYVIEPDATIEDLDFVEGLKASIQHTLQTAHEALEEMVALAVEAFGLQGYSKLAAEEEAFARVALQLATTGTWQDLYDHLQQASWVRMPIIKKADNPDKEQQDIAKHKRDVAKDLVKGVKETFFMRSPKQLLQEIRMMEPIVATLVKLAVAYSEAFKREKLARGFVDFSDLEHYALEILAVKEDGQFKPSAVAKEFQQRFKEVLVDEYQDVNFLQETILQLVKSGGEADGNMFMVGDVKQSIYAFRLAEPQLFLDKYSRFLAEPKASGRKIDLNQNFRSRSEVLEGTNYIFSQVMDANVGEIEYDERAALKYSNGYPADSEPVELVILQGDKETVDEEEETIQQSQQEARYIIRRIQHMMDAGHQVYDAKKKAYRPLQYKDIVILMRSMRWSGDLAEEFKAAGIPLYAESSKGYFDALEVMVMMNLLQVIDNPYQDIPLASVLRAPFIGLTENELAEIRLAKANVPFYEAFKTYVYSEKAQGETALKLRTFMEQLMAWRNAARRGSLAELIWQIYLETNYYEMVGAMVNGKQRQANLRALHDRALAYEKTSFRGLFRFLRFIDRMKSRGDDLGLAKSIGEANDVVRLVTIHSSKGLEFPVVFVAGLSGKFNTQDFNSPYLFDQKFGLAVKTVDPEHRVMYTSLPFLALKEQKLAKLKAEEMRILYVAMTRAKEKLILVSSVKDWDKTKDKWEKLQNLPEGIVLPDHLRASAMNYMDWIGPAVARHKDFLTLALTEEEREAEILTKSLWKVTVLANDEFRQSEQEEQAEQQLDHSKNVNAELLQTLTARFTKAYSHQQATTKKSKTSVSEIKRFEVLTRAEEEEPTAVLRTTQTEQKKRQMTAKALAKRPAFLVEKKMTGAEVGTVVHTVMQHVPQQGFTDLAEANAFLQELVARELISAKEAESVQMEAVLTFFASDIGARFKQAKQMLREKPFTLSRVDGEGDAQIVQGIIDCLFQEEDGKWVLLDYKTDRIRAPFDVEPQLTEEMSNRYLKQLDIYTQAVEEITGVRVSERLLYLYDVGQTIQL